MDSINYLSAPLFVWWNVTYACNLRCRQCYSNSGKSHPEELSTEEAKSVIRQLAKMKVFYIYFLGGEPLMRKDIFELAEYASEHRIATTMSTNGWFITPTIANDLEKTGFMHVRVSLDGVTAKTHDSIRGVKGSFDRAINAIRILKETNIVRIGISPTVLSENINEMPALIELGLELKVDEIQLVQLCKRGRGTYAQPASTEQLIRLRNLFTEYKNRLAGKLNLTATEGISLEESLNTNNNSSLPDFWGCPAGRTCLSIEAEGTIQPCILYNISAGNIRKKSINKIWEESPLFRKIRTPDEECEGCHYLKVCSGECPIDSCVDRFFRRQYVKCQKKGGKIHASRKGNNDQVG
jgi:radical SAM protein with 4Fe4S-binding SPASM domain